MTLVSKIESIEEHQALEKYCLHVVNKQWGAKLEAIEGLIKTLLSQAQEKPSSAFVQNMGTGYSSGNNSELLGRPLENFLSGAELICFRCGESGCFQNNCEQVKALFTKGAIVHNKKRRVCLLDGLWVPNIPIGVSLVEHVDRYYATMKPVQSFHGTFEEIKDICRAPSQESTSVGTEIDEHEQRIAKAEKELELRERESALKVKQYKLKAKASERADLLEHFDQELSALQEGMTGKLPEENKTSKILLKEADQQWDSQPETEAEGMWAIIETSA